MRRNASSSIWYGPVSVRRTPVCIEMGARIQQVFLDFATLDEVKFPEVSRLTP